MTDSAVGARRLVGKVVFFLALCWLVVLIAGVAGAVRGASLDPFNFAIMLIPGCAFAPAAHFAIKLHTTANPERLNQLWLKALIYGGAGLVLLFGAGYGLYQAGQA